ncbi:MAG TPA: molybdopterin synthase sulfur carrier subunit, partial [Microbacterium sp.]|nr:molybdopterin synthase sulfur carrier subunit [Microbacterium sp.]
FVLPRCAVLVNGERTDADMPLSASDVVDILPPFAGG